MSTYLHQAKMISSWTNEMSLKHTWLPLSMTTQEFPLLLRGDFNARLGMDNDFLEKVFRGTGKFYNPDDPITDTFLPRFFKDKIANFSGYCLTKLIYRWRLYVLNGSLPDDHLAEYTYIIEQGSSTIHYIISSYQEI